MSTIVVEITKTLKWSSFGERLLFQRFDWVNLNWPQLGNLLPILAKFKLKGLEPMVTFNVKLTPEDCIEAHYFISAKKIGMLPGRQVIYVLAIYLSVCLAILGVTAAIDFKLLGSKIFPVILLIFLIAAISVWNVFITVPKNIRRTLSRNPAFLVERKIVVSPNRLETISINASVDMQLSSCVKYESSQDLILLYCSEVGYDVFPRRCFKSDEDFQTVLSYLEASLGSPKPWKLRDYL